MFGRRLHALTLPAAALMAAAALFAPLPGEAQNPMPRLRGDIVSVDLPTLVVATADGQTVNVTLNEGYAVRSVTPATFEDIEEGTALGLVSVPAGDRRVALEVHLFPPGGTFNQGHNAWDLVAEENTMTNGIVGTVTEMGADREITLGYAPAQGEPGEQRILLPDDIQVVQMGPGSPDLITPGSYVVIFGEPGPDGTYLGRSLTVGVDGARAPM